MSKILVVDDDKNILAAFEQMLGEQGYDVSKALHAQEALNLIREQKRDLVIMDIRMPGLSGLEALRKIKEVDFRLPVIIITGYGTMDTAVKATKLGAIDYHIKPLNPEEILESISGALESVHLMSKRVELDTEDTGNESDVIIGRSKCMREVYKAIGRVAETDATVLIRGETGTGKELIARAVYQHSRRSDAALVVVNCVAIPETLLESEFFGYEKGAFTGAQKRKIGKFEQADKGTIFLDEIGAMPLHTQAKLLRVLQDKTFERIGGTEKIQVDVRIIAATNRNLESAMKENQFREDLYHRLRVFTIDLPPLRDRTEDIPRLAKYFLKRLSVQMCINEPTITDDAMDILCGYKWPGNVRELQNCLQQAIILTQGYPVHAEHINKALDAVAKRPEMVSGSNDFADLKALIKRYLSAYKGKTAHADFLEKAEKFLLSEALKTCKGNQTHAAKFLGIPRPTLKAKLDRFGLSDR